MTLTTLLHLKSKVSNAQSPKFLNKMTVNKKQVTKLRSLLSNIEQLILKLDLIKLSDAAKLQHTSRQNLSYYIQNGELRHEILFGQIYVYKIDILEFKRSRPGPKTPAPLPHPTIIGLPYKSFQIIQNEDLRSFINRVRLAAVRETITIEGTVTRAAKRLHYGQTFFYKLYKLLESPETLTTNKTEHPLPYSKQIHLPTNLFVIKPNEGLRSFIDRIQLAVITKAIATESSTQKAANRLGYEHDALLTLVRTLKSRADRQSNPRHAETSVPYARNGVQTKNALPVLLHSFSVEPNEDLRSFIARLQLSAIQQAITIEENVTRAARRLHYRRTALHQLRKRLQSSNHTANQPQPGSGKITLPTSIFVIRDKEGLQDFIARIQLAIITKSIKVEGNKTKAAARLGYRREALSTLLHKLTHSTTSSVKTRLPHLSSAETKTTITLHPTNFRKTK